MLSFAPPVLPLTPESVGIVPSRPLSRTTLHLAATGVAGQESQDLSDQPSAVHAGAAIGAALLACIIIGAVIAGIVALVMLTTGAAVIARKTMHKIDEKHAFEGEVVTTVGVPMGDVFEPDAEWIENRMSSLEAQEQEQFDAMRENPMARRARPLSRKIADVFSRLSAGFARPPLTANSSLPTVAEASSGPAGIEMAEVKSQTNVVVIGTTAPSAPSTGAIDALFAEDHGALDLGLVEDGADDSVVIDHGVAADVVETVSALDLGLENDEYNHY